MTTDHDERTPRQRDRDARVVLAVARACGFSQPVAPVILRRVPDVQRLVDQDDATLRRVLGDDQLRTALRQGLVAAFRDVWRQATLERMRLDHGDWLRQWWLPVCADAELDALVSAPPPRADHRRVAIHHRPFPATIAAAELLLDEHGRRRHGAYLLVERRLATAVLDLAVEVAHAEGRTLPAARDGHRIDEVPTGEDPRAFDGVGWWHGPS
ncbi:hypothetical protein FTX61_13150 [Nitriliruptoraceae bacterium ZYF776]|nr:hypothetical protein [Profundirhabdus halotolerans]